MLDEAPETQATEQENQQAPEKTEELSWDELRGTLASEIESALKDEEEGEEGSEEGEGEKPAEGEPQREGEEKAEGEEEAKGEEEGEPPPPSGRFRVLDANGDEYVVDPLPDGARIEFKADGQVLAVTSWDELVDLAQRGAILPRVHSKLESARAKAESEAQRLRERLQTAEQRFREIVEDVEKYKQYRRQARRLLDPEIREALEAKERLSLIEAQRQEQEAAQRQEIAQEFWQAVKERFESQLPQHEYLSAEDWPEVQRLYWEGFERHRRALEAQERALEPEADDSRIRQRVDRLAVQWLTEEHLDETVRQLAERYAKRLRPQKETAEAEAHNRRIEKLAEQKSKSPKPLRSRGAPPLSRGTAPEPKTWKDHLALMRAELRQMREPLEE